MKVACNNAAAVVYVSVSANKNKLIKIKKKKKRSKLNTHAYLPSVPSISNTSQVWKVTSTLLVNAS